MDKTLKQSTKQQLDKLIGLMENNPDLARGKPQFGSNKKLVGESWESFAVQLNSLGPPSRTGNEWSRVWTHYKANLKRKLAANKQNFLATRGGPSQEVSLNPNEQRVMELISLNTAVRPIGNSLEASRKLFLMRATLTHVSSSSKNKVTILKSIKLHKNQE